MVWAGVLLMLIVACQSLAPARPDAVIAAREAQAIEALLRAQDAAWNRGDIDAFMAGYWVSPELRFASGGTVTRGWNETNARYKSRYATRALMGELTTSDYDIALLAPDAAIAHGSWRLTRAGDKPSGLYTLILRKIGGQWRIVSDTTTSADE